MIGCIPSTAEIVTPGNHPIPPDHHALTNAKVIIKPGTTLNDATVVINNGRIINVTENGKPPKTARVWDMRTKKEVHVLGGHSNTIGANQHARHNKNA